jgi:hypothetical protein
MVFKSLTNLIYSSLISILVVFQVLHHRNGGHEDLGRVHRPIMTDSTHVPRRQIFEGEMCSHMTCCKRSPFRLAKEDSSSLVNFHTSEVQVAMAANIASATRLSGRHDVL